MKKYVKTFQETTEYNTYTADTTNFVKPNVSYIRESDNVIFNPIDYSKKYLTFVALESGTFKFSNTAYYSLDDGKTWTSLAANTNTPTVAAGKRILWKANITPQPYVGVGTFSEGTCRFNAEGNPMSLTYGDNFIGQTTLPSSEPFSNFMLLFYGNTQIVKAKNLSLVATMLYEYCYAVMFQNCTSLTTAPKLPATTLASFCYHHMFNGCTSLTTAPELPATTLASGCYFEMFYGCTSLTTAPELPATTLVSSCYNSMFQGCTSLTAAPELLATALTSSCYDYMFSGCTNLNYIKAMFTTTPSGSYTYNWVKNVASNGTFVKNSAATWTSGCGASTYPCNWTVETA